MLTTLLFSLVATQSSLAPTHLRCEYMTNPVGIDEPVPRLSWIDESRTRGAKQTAYEILVASDPKLLSAGKADLWDSNRIDSASSVGIEYKGTPLKSGQRAYWTVMLWDGAGGVSRTAKTAYWEAAMMDQGDWKASWIGMPDALSKINGARPSPLLRKSFRVDKRVVSARAYVSAKGLYKLYLDGHRVGNDIFTPGWTDYRKRVQYQTYDVTRLLGAGRHAVGMELGDGWYCGAVGWTKGNNYGTKPLGLVQIEIRYADGSQDHVISDGSWQAGTGPVRSDDLLMGESYDARLAASNWASTGFNSGAWSPVDVVASDVPLVAQHSPTVQKLAELTPKAISQPKMGNYVFDLGQNMVGWARLKVSGAAGTKVQLRFAEMLNPDGTIYTTNLRGARATDTYTLAGNGDETYEPSFTFHGFRYVEVTGYPGTPTTDAITGVVVGSNNPQTGWFECSNPLVNQLQHNIYWGQRGNYVDVPTDCPQRDERLGWMGDAEVFAPTACLNNDVDAFLTKWTQDVVDAQSPAGGFSDVSPRIVDQSDGAPAWGDAGVIVPWVVYQSYNDKRLLARRYDAMKAWVDYIDTVNPDHIWIKRSNNNFGDWLNVHDDTPRDVIATAYFAYSTALLSQSANILGKTEDVQKYSALWQEIVHAFDASFVSADGVIKGDTQTDYVMALRFHLIPDSLRANAADRLVHHIMVDRNGHLSTGFVGVGNLNLVLTEAGHTDVAYKLLTNDTYPSWGYSIRQGATTIWERWDGWTQDKGFQDPGMNSFNHYSLGAVGNWMFRTVGGIAQEPGSAGYVAPLLHPIPGGGITWAKSAFDSIEGRIESAWRLNGNDFVYNCTVPANTTATVYIPASRAEDVRESNGPATGSPGVHFLRMEPGFVVFQVDGGKYRFEAKQG